MHRTVQISLPSSDSQELCDELAALETGVAVTRAENATINPCGD